MLAKIGSNLGHPRLVSHRAWLDFGRFQPKLVDHGRTLADRNSQIGRLLPNTWSMTSQTVDPALRLAEPNPNLVEPSLAMAEPALGMVELALNAVGSAL